MQPTHRKQADEHVGRELTYVERSFSGQSQSSGETYSETTSTITGRVKDMTSLGQGDTGLEKIGEIPDDGVVVMTSDPSSIDEDDQFEIDGDRFDILEVMEKTGDGGTSTYYRVYCKPDR